MIPLFQLLLRFIPKNHLSYVVGRLATTRRFPTLQRKLIRAFAKHYNVALSDMVRPLEEFSTLGEFFVRELKPGIRPVGTGVVSPVDGAIVEFGEIMNGTMLQVKGKRQSLEMLLRDRELATRFQHGFFLTLYLAPRDYHRVHSPVAGLVTDLHLIPGKLWPVNTWSVRKIDNLYGVNERVVVTIESDFGKVAVVMVGATNVGSMRVSFDAIETNSRSSLLPKFMGGGPREGEHRRYIPPKPIQRGAHLGTFHFGSTVVLLLEAGRFRPAKRLELGPIRFGESLSA